MGCRNHGNFQELLTKSVGPVHFLLTYHVCLRSNMCMKTIWGEKIVPQLHHFLLQKKVPQQQVLNPKKVIMQLRWRTMKGIDRQQPHLARQYNAIP